MQDDQVPDKKSDKGIVIHQDNPFRDDLIQFLKRESTATRILTMDGYKATQTTIIQQSTYIKAPFTKVYHNVALFQQMGPYECMLFLYIAHKMDYNSQQVLIDYKELNMNRRTLAKALLELTGLMMIRKVQNVKQTYWVNLSYLISGHLLKPIDGNASCA